MWVYIESDDDGDTLFTVGFYDPKGNWHSDSDHSERSKAQSRVNYLNGGNVSYAV